MAETQIPIAAGKAAALSTYLARGGRLVTKTRGGDKRAGERYATGPMRGMTVEQATQKFERMWAGASPAIKDKYASRDTAAVALSPSEQKGMGANFRPGASMSARGSEAGSPAAAPTVSPAPAMATPPAQGTFIEDRRRPGKPIKTTGFEALTDPNQRFEEIVTDLNGDGKVNDADAQANSDAQAKNNYTPAPPRENKMGGRGRVGGTSVSGQNARAQTGASPSAPVAMKQDAAKVAPAPVATAKPATAAPIAPALNSLRPAPDFTPGPGKELTGMSGGRPTYTNADALYGAAGVNVTEKPTAPDQPVMAPAKPVMQRFDTKPQSMEQRRADYQTREGNEIATRSAPRAIPVIEPTPKRPDPTENGGAFGRDAYARTAAAQQTGIEREAIRNGTASQATRDKNADYAKSRDEGIAMDAEINRGRSYGGEAPKVGGPGSTAGSKVIGIRPAPMFGSPSVKKPGFAMARR